MQVSRRGRYDLGTSPAGRLRPTPWGEALTKKTYRCEGPTHLFVAVILYTTRGAGSLASALASVWAAAPGELRRRVLLPSPGLFACRSSLAPPLIVYPARYFFVSVPSCLLGSSREVGWRCVGEDGKGAWPRHRR